MQLTWGSLVTIRDYTVDSSSSETEDGYSSFEIGCS